MLHSDWFGDDASMDKALQEAGEILSNNGFCILATCGDDGRPWVTPLFYNYDAAYVLYWESARNSRHTRIIEANPNVAIVVSDMAGVRGVYLEAIADEVGPEDLDRALECLLHGPHKRDRGERSAADYAADRPLGLYSARPVAAYLMTDAKNVDGYMLDERIPIELRWRSRPT